ncbi:uncharacterized protein LOC113228607 [Hyposmocoma kahamanoa]|uniref:uncharacterized protein LOC113228607 n=1 Tax=Hyposmocoma kahamanoa TaxID=1477025 RepID=UPI000E6D8202|nr:uncharacterized protein LOC113228607 [Hyposmocoma kahamanoa]
MSMEWHKIRKELEDINQIKIPRWFGSSRNESIELHGFCDASTKAYACVNSISCKNNKQPRNSNQQPSIVIAAAKARLVPVKKTVTLPRLELTACLLLSKLMKTVQDSLSGHHITVFGWTDSTAALGWLQGDPNRWKAFVANRVQQITVVMPAECWQHVKSGDNPADCASRGISVDQLKQHPLWWTGPSWLQSFTQNQEPAERHIYVTDEEIKTSLLSNVATEQRADIVNDIIHKYSSITRATRVLGWVLRAVTRNRPKQSYLSIEELERAKIKIVERVQQTEFTSEISSLRNQDKLSSKSKIFNLNPYIDHTGLLRVGGRIKHANIDDSMKHPLVIPHSSHLTNLLIDQAHRDTFHGGARLTQARLRQHYWIVGGNRAVKKHLRNCVTCRRHDPLKQTQQMGDLPAARSNPTRPFYNTGVDFTGCVDVKANKGRGVKTTKGYIAVFVCMVTKAVHLELVSDLSATAFIAALRRMAARRGAPRHVYCDNGTNFVGTEFYNKTTSTYKKNSTTSS